MQENDFSSEKIEELKEKALRLPQLPGVYIMKDKSGKIIYIGKAKALKNRVVQYFRNIQAHQQKVFQMVTHAHDFDYTVTDSEFEALVLECSLIKQYNPKYNILLKDDKGYHYIKLSDGCFPKITASKQKDDPQATYLGPYVSSFVVKQMVEDANRIYMLPTCKKRFPQEIGRGRPCLQFYIKQCMAPCRGKISSQEYIQAYKEAVDYIKGSGNVDIGRLASEMEQAAENLEFERAAKLRDRIEAIRRISQNQKVVMTRVAEQDVIALAEGIAMYCICIFKYRQGRMCDREDHIFSGTQDVSELLSEFLTRYYSQIEDIPRQITLDRQIEDIPLLSRYISQRAGHAVKLTVPLKGEQFKLVQMVRNNASEKLSQQTDRTGKEIAALDELAGLLSLPQVPRYIESYDISNLGDAHMVAGMVVFRDGRPLKSAYRKFEIKEQYGQDDYGAMREVITRRFQRYFEEKEKGEGFGVLPDLILLDGGKGHVSTVVPVLEGLGLKIPVFGMVKDDKHRSRAIASNGGEISILSNRAAFTLISKIQEEVHRFAITYQRTHHKNATLALSITKVEGIGQKRAQQLFAHFKTLKAMKQASIEELSSVKGMSEKTARALYEFLHQ